MSSQILKACPACDSTRVKVTPRSEHRYRCDARGCGHTFNQAVERERYLAPNGPTNGLAAKLAKIGEEGGYL